MTRSTILIGFGDALAAPETIFSLRSAGFNIRLFVRQGHEPLVVRHLPVGVPIYIPSPEDDADAAVAALRDAAEQIPDLGAVLALDDAAIWLTDRAFGLGQDGVDGNKAPRLASATGDLAAFALDKQRQVAAAKAAGFTPPATQILEAQSDISLVDQFPSIVKSALAAQVSEGKLRRGGAAYLTGAEDAVQLSDVLYPALAQPLITGTGEGLFGFATSKGVVGWSAHRRIRMMNPHGSGASSCCAIVPDPALVEKGAALVSAVGWRGPFMIELLRDEDGQAWFIEFNGRIWGSTALARRAGFEYPAWAAEQALDQEFEPNITPMDPPEEVRHLGRDLLHILFTIRGPKTDFHKIGWPSPWRSATKVFRPGARRSFYNYDPENPWYFLHDAVATVRATFRKSRRTR